MTAPDLTPAQRAEQHVDAMLFPAPDLPDLPTRPFNDTVLELCRKAGLTLFTLEALAGDLSRMSESAMALGPAEINRQCLSLLYIVGFPDVKAMLKAVRSPEFFDEHVVPWTLELPANPHRMAKLMEEWQRYTLHSLAALVKILPREGESPDADPPN